MADQLLSSESATLRGAQLVLERFERRRKAITHYSQLSVWQNNRCVKIRVDDVLPHNMALYLSLLTREIERLYANTQKPASAVRHVETMQQFVQSIIFHKMFSDDDHRD